MNDLEKETLNSERIKKQKEYQRQWALKNKDRIREKQRKWELENRDRLKEQSHQRYLERREEILERCRKRHNRLKKNPDYMEKRRIYAIERREKQRQWFNGLKKEKQCAHCGESRLPCLEYHHLDPSTKEFPISYAFGQITGNKERILNEIKKCILLCANCHRILHSNESS